MSWFRSKAKSNPVYSQVGEEIYRLLTVGIDGWTYRHNSTLPDLIHEAKRLTIISSYRRADFRYKIGDVNVAPELTPDDIDRLNAAFWKAVDQLRDKGDLQTRLARRRVVDGLLGDRGIDPKPTEIALAMAVLDGDHSAARPLVDRLLEIWEGK